MTWWSSSTFVTTPISGRSSSIVRSDSSPSTTSQPSPVPAFPPSCGTSAPITKAGSRPSSRSANAISAVVVDLPCVPPTTIERRSETSSARNSARLRPATVGYALETTLSHPSRSSGSGETTTSIPTARTAAR